MAPPKSRVTDPISANALAMVELIWHLQNGEYAKTELAELTGLSIHTVLRWMRLLSRPGKKLIYICEWRRRFRTGAFQEIWTWGPGTINTPKPKGISHTAEYIRKYRQDKKMKVLANLTASSTGELNESSRV